MKTFHVGVKKFADWFSNYKNSLFIRKTKTFKVYEFSSNWENEEFAVDLFTNLIYYYI